MPIASAPPPEAPPATPVFRIAYVQQGEEYSLRLFRLGDGPVMISGYYQGEQLLQIRHDVALRVGGPAILPVEGYLAGLGKVLPESPPDFHVSDLLGSGLEDLTAEVNVPGDRGGSNHVVRRQQGRWTLMPEPRYTREYWSAYYLGGLFNSVRMSPEVVLYEGIRQNRDGSFQVALFYANVRRGPGPALAPSTVKGCSNAILKHALLAAQDGALLGLGQLCEEGEAPDIFRPSHGVLAVERWPKDDGKSRIEPLPGGPRLSPDVEGADQVGWFFEGNKTWVWASVLGPDKAAKPYIAVHDGSSWKDLSPPSGGALSSVLRRKDGLLAIGEKGAWALADGSSEWKAVQVPEGPLRFAEQDLEGRVWAAFGGGLFRWTSGGKEFTRIPLPDVDGAPSVPAHLLFTDQGEALLKVTTGGQVALLRSQVNMLQPTANQPAEAVVKGPLGALKEGVAYGRVTAAHPGCKEPFVQMFKLNKVAPADYDFPLTRKALKGHTEFGGVGFLEAQDGPHRYFIAKVKTVEQGRKLAEVIRKGVKDSSPQVLCGQPAKVNRELKIDLRSGDLVK